jgi:creatinine amidohydrolase
MTSFFSYADLTWPEISILSRSTPLVIPLGTGYPLPLLADALDQPAVIGLLPPIPFGWRGSGLSVAERSMGQFVQNLVQSLRDDGFSHVFALKPPGVALNPGSAAVSLPTSALRLPPLPDDRDHAKVILIPVGHTEQHGFHLPMSTDTLIVETICRNTSETAPQQAASLPCMPYGVSTHRASFAGTLNAGGRAFEDFWLDVVDNLAERGFERMYFISGHGGNCSFLVTVVKYAGERHPNLFCATSFLYLSGPQGVEALQARRQSPMGGMGHACELETSLMLHIQPGLVHMDRVVDEIDFISTPSYYMDWIEGGALIANPPWEDDSATGALGAGSLGTAEKGAFWLSVAVAEKTAHVNEIHEQHRRRTEHREKNRPQPA